MRYPNLEQYQEALRHPTAALSDPDLRGGRVALNGLGWPIVHCGGSALTYRVDVHGEPFAFRCFRRQDPNLHERYAAIADFLRKLSSPHFVDFEYQPEGVRVQDQNFPIVKMAWAPGETLGAFLERAHGDRLAVRALLTSLRELAQSLDAAGIAHGDLQPGNLVVSRQGRSLQLIDYDGIYMDSIRHLGGTEPDHGNLQHPRRHLEHPFHARLDRFAFLSLSIALMALALAPDLWESSGSNLETVLFRPADFENPIQSEIFFELASIPGLNRKVRQLAAVCQAPLDQTPSLEDFLADRNIPVPLPDLTSRHRRTLPRRYLSTSPVLDATNFGHCLAAVGERVELIGRVTRVHHSRTRWGDEFTFLNFGPWTENIAKINIWADGLRVLREVPDRSWEGRWVSAIGLMEPPWSSPQHGYQHLAVTITQCGQLHLLSDAEAHYRLAAARMGAARLAGATSPSLFAGPVSAAAQPSCRQIVSAGMPLGASPGESSGMLSRVARWFR